MEDSNHEDRIEQKAEETAEEILTFLKVDPPIFNITFSNPDNEKIGELRWTEGGKLEFQGDAEESAQKLFDFTCSMMNDNDYKFKHEPNRMRHLKLHRALDELLACHLTQTGNLLADTSVMSLVEWSHRMTEAATCEETEHDEE